MRLFILYNPHAGAGRAKKLLPKVKEAFENRGITPEFYLTSYPSHGTEIIQNLDFSDYDGIVAAGGDGTLFECVNGYFRNTAEHFIPVGVLPVGTGNAFARDLYKDTADWEEAVDVICGGKTRKVDAGSFIMQDKTFYYLNILGLGFVADVTETAYKLKQFGNVAYLLGVLYQTLFLKSHSLKLTIDGTVYTRDNIFVEVSNTRYTSNFLMAPDAEIDDGYLDVTLLGACSRIKLLKSLPTVFDGTHVDLDIVETFRAKKITIETEPAKILTPDGELIGSTPVSVSCLHKAVTVYSH